MKKAGYAVFAGLTILLCGCTHTKARDVLSHGEISGEVHIASLIASSYWIARQETKTAHKTCPDYLEALLADGRLTIGLGIGTQDLGEIRVPDQPERRVCRQRLRFFGKTVDVEGRLITTNQEFAAALSECEIVFVQSHSRFGAGPVFYHDGKARPYRMQNLPSYEIIMPEEEVSGYAGKVKRTSVNPVTGKRYVVFEPDSSDLDAALPLHSYQLIVLSTCSSLKHFRDSIARFRGIYPTTAILTTRPCCADMSLEIFVTFLADVFQGKSLDAVVDGMNRTYRIVAERRVRMGIQQWKVIDNLYAIGLHTIASQ